jgi:enoyl-CoA hydratase/carnithine racemase
VDVRHLTLNELRTAIDTGDAEDLSTVAGSAVVSISDDHETDQAIAALAPRLASVPCVLVADPALDRLAPVVDVFAGGAELDTILGAVERTPLAATAMVVLLRSSLARTIDEGLVAESVTYSMLQGGPEFAQWRAGRQRRQRPEPPEAVLTDRVDGTLTITLNRPHVHNAFSRSMRDGLAEALAVAMADDSIDRILLQGAGPSFCSGGDLDEFGDFPDPAASHVIRLTRSPARLVARLSPRVEVRTHGSCMGAGAELPAFAGRVVAHPATRFALPELSLGLVPGAGGTVSLPRRIGRHRTALLGLTGTPIDATTAFEWGLVDAIDT